MIRVSSVLRIVLFSVIGLVVVPYTAVLGYLYVNQRPLLYPADHTQETPDALIAKGLLLQDVRIKTPDGETLDAWYHVPLPGKPTILFLHGNGGTPTEEKWRYLRMQAKGVGFLALSYRGYNSSTGTPTEQGLLIDGLAAYDWLRVHGTAANDIVIHGHSLGSGVAVYLATKRPARALILESPFTAASDVAAYHYPLIPVALLMTDRFLSRERIKDVHIPILIAHGDRDQLIPFEEGVELYNLANAPKTFVHMHGSDHSTLTRDGAYECYWKFLGLDYDHAKASVCAPL
jgi:fermentation-respiration switch protein FrsA (DUF1100 family)